MSVETTALLTTISGLLMPLVIAFLNQPYWTAQVKLIVSAVAAGLAGLIVALTSGLPLTFANLAELIGLGIGASQAAYAFLWKPTGVAGAIERSTQIAPDPKDPSTDPLIE